MNAIFAFNKMNYHYKPMNDDFLRLAKLSVKSAKKYYNTKFYGDKDSYEYFSKNEVVFDNVVIINDQDIFKYHNIYSISKIYAMMKETEPYIVMDFDVVLFEKLESSHSITYGQKEHVIHEDIAFNELIWLYDSYITPFNQHLKDYYINQLELFRWTIFPSFYVMMVNNPKFIKESYKDIFNRIPVEVINKITPTLFEQLLIHQYVNIYNVDYGFFHEKHNYREDSEFNFMNIISKKFVHLNINKDKIVDELNYLESII